VVNDDQSGSSQKINLAAIGRLSQRHQRADTTGPIRAGIGEATAFVWTVLRGNDNPRCLAISREFEIRTGPPCREKGLALLCWLVFGFAELCD
jgi:hypothetical protein